MLIVAKWFSSQSRIAVANTASLKMSPQSNEVGEIPRPFLRLQIFRKRELRFVLVKDAVEVKGRGDSRLSH